MYDIIYKVTVRPTTPPWVRIVMPCPDWWKQCCCKGTMEIRTLHRLAGPMQGSTFIYIIWRTRLHDLRESLRVFLYTLQANCCQPSVCLLAAHAVLPPPCFQVLKNLTSCSPWLCCQISRTSISPSSTQNACICRYLFRFDIWIVQNILNEIFRFDCRHSRMPFSFWKSRKIRSLLVKPRLSSLFKSCIRRAAMLLHHCTASSAVTREMSRPVVLLTFSSS